MEQTNRITVTGIIHFDPEHLTRKHEEQGSWKKMALVLIDGEVCFYYAWFLNRRFNLVLNKPQRGAHISFINDSFNDMSQNGSIPMKEVERRWNAAKREWEGKRIEVTLDVSPRTDDEHWWLPVPHEARELLQKIRSQVGLGKPFWGMHMSLGYANERNIEHSKYIHRQIKKFDL